MAEFLEDFNVMLDAAEEMIGAGEYEQARLLLLRMQELFPDAPEVFLLLGDMAMETFELDQALEMYNRAVSLDPEWSVGLSARADCLLEMGRLADASRDAKKALKLDRNNAQAYWVRAVVAEFAGNQGLAEACYKKAARLLPDTYHVPFRVSREFFDAAATRAIEKLPARFKDLMVGVQVFVRDLPESWDELGPLLLGMHEGEMLTEQSLTAPQMPPRIFLYQKNIERVCRNQEEIEREIELTVLHEVGHYFGLEDEDLERLERGSAR